jgi:Polyketide cyclase / dehydrase and lipid transport
MRPAKIFISAVAVLLLLFVGIGLALPGEWQARRTRELAVPPEVVWPYVNSLAGWEAWTPWDAVADTVDGPPEGVGARRRWDDPQWGQGEWVLTASEPFRRVTYEVHVENGALVTRGEIVLEAVAGGTAVSWREQGDFGWNPFLAYMARGMDRRQGAEMEKNLAALDSVVGGGQP